MEDSVALGAEGMNGFGAVQINHPPVNPQPTVSKIYVGPNTPLACTNCHRIGMPIYYLKRANGLYDVLCFDYGRGCWEHSSRNLCSYIDREEAQCMDLSEWSVVYGKGSNMTHRSVCSRHIAAVLGNAPSYKLFPIDRE